MPQLKVDGFCCPPKVQLARLGLVNRQAGGPDRPRLEMVEQGAAGPYTHHATKHWVPAPRPSAGACETSDVSRHGVLGCGTLLNREILRDPLHRGAQSARERYLRQVVGEEAGDEIKIRRSEAFLGLHHFHCIGNTRVVALVGQVERLAGENLVVAGEFHLAGRGLQIEQPAADFAFHPAAHVFEFGAALIHRGLRLHDVAFNAPALPDRYA